MKKSLIVIVLLLSSFAAADPLTFDLSMLTGENGFVLLGIDEHDSAGHSVSGAGDVNGDGFHDIILGAYLADGPDALNVGETYLVYGGPEFSPVIFLSELDESMGSVFRGVEVGDHAGESVAGIGDVNGDGFDDIAIGANSANNGGFDTGSVYIVYGAPSLPFELSLDDLDGVNGMRIDGIDLVDNAGGTVAGAGDVNNDGLDDIIIGAKAADPSGNLFSGESYVVFGSTTLPAILKLADLDGTNGFVAYGIDKDDSSGGHVAGAGDVNLDGFDDIIIGAHKADPDGQQLAGETYVVFGAPTFPASIELETLDGTNGFTIIGADAGDWSGFSVAPAGDVDGNNREDLMIGAPHADVDGAANVGRGYMVSGAGSFPPVVDLETFDGVNAVVFNGIDAFDDTGSSVASIGDVNNDGKSDVLFGAPSTNDIGQVHIVYGHPDFPDEFDLETLDGMTGVTLLGVDEGDLAGFSVSGAGDVNGDGFDDIVVGAPHGDRGEQTNAGEVYVVFGAPEIVPPERDVQLAVAGSCPGEITISVTGGVPDERFSFWVSQEQGSFIFNDGLCPGLRLGLENPSLRVQPLADENGDFSLTMNPVEEACGLFVQVVDLSCALSNVAQIPENS